MLVVWTTGDFLCPAQVAQLAETCHRSRQAATRRGLQEKSPLETGWTPTPQVALSRWMAKCCVDVQLPQGNARCWPLEFHASRLSKWNQPSTEPPQVLGFQEDFAEVTQQFHMQTGSGSICIAVTFITLTRVAVDFEVAFHDDTLVFIRASSDP